MAVPAAQFVAEAGAVPGRVGGEAARLGERPAHPSRAADDRGLVGHGEDGGEPDAEPAHRAVALLALGGGPQRGQRLDTGGVQRRAGVGGDEHAVAQGQGEAAGDTRAGGRVGGVLGELDDETVAVAAEGEILLGVGVLTEAGRAACPGIENPTPQTGRPERVHPLRCRAHDLAHAHGVVSL